MVDVKARVEDALATLNRLAETGGEVVEGQIDLTSLDAEDFRWIRRAIRTLKREGHPGGLGNVLALMIYAPALTPLLAAYLETVPDGAADVIDTVIERVSLSDWQALWLVRLLRVLGLLDDESADGPVKWLRERCIGRVDPALRAEAFLALAEQGKASFEELEFHLRIEPDVLSPWYVEAIDALAATPQPPSQSSIDAVRLSHPMFALMMNPR
ncbi:MAG: hypothetical protein GEU79_03435 [Acidimicrobiia bacterium]|nr:hypothetical protein [Acidimicrobiia bacterium]